jgi:protease-4
VNTERSKGIVGIFILVAILFLIFISFAFFAVSKLQTSSNFASESIIDEGDGAIAVIKIEGEIVDSKDVVEMLHEAEEDKTIKAIILRIDSPGGAVAPTQDIYEEVRRIDKKIPIFASFGSLAASGGYYIGAAARKIYANSGTLTGSIGVIMSTMDLSELFQFVKVKPATIKAGRYKDIGNQARPMTEEEKKLLQDLLAVTHKQFINDIMAVRKDRIVGDINELAQGQIFSGEEAQKYGLVDEIATLWQAGRKIHTSLKIKQKFGFRYLKKKNEKFSLREFFQESKTLLGDIRKTIAPKSGVKYIHQF